MEETSRVFVKGLPPTINEADFRKHFSRGQITDIQLKPQRRLGFIGFSTPSEAKQAVKLFNKSFIRMSRISVELARPIADPTLSQPQHAKPGPSSAPALSLGAGRSRNEPKQDDKSEASPKKRKREVNESDPKLQEFLGVMQHAKNSANKIHGMDMMDGTASGATDGPGAPIPSGDASDDEYETVPSRPSKRVALQPGQSAPPTKPHVSELPRGAPDTTASDEPPAGPMSVDEPEKAPPRSGDAVAATDEDFLRRHTNRLLDFLDDDEITPVNVDNAQPEAPPAPQPSSGQDGVSATPSPEPRQTAEAVSKAGAQGGSTVDSLDSIRRTRRLFMRNIAFTATEEDLKSFLARFGEMEEVHIPMDRKAGQNKGVAFVLFAESESAVAAFQAVDGTAFQGRLVHVLPASQQRDVAMDEFELSKLPLKTQAKIRKKREAASAKFSWSTLYMDPNAVLDSTANRLGVSRSELLDPTNADAAVKQALAEASTIQDTKAYFLSHGIDLNSFKSSERGDATILVKNFPYGTSPEELRTLFEEHGRVLKVLMPPTGTIAVVQFAQAHEGKTAFRKLAYSQFKGSMLFLEKGPKTLFTADQQETAEVASGAANKKLSASELLERSDDADNTESTTLFVKGLNFSTTTADLTELAGKLEGFRSARVKTKPDPKKPGAVLSMGFGFTEWSSREAAEAAMKVLDGYELHDHKLQVRLSHRGHDAAEEQRRADNAKKLAGQHSKILVKNLPFQATKKDLRTLFGTYGQLQAVRIPRNHMGRSRGYAFVSMSSPQETVKVMSALQDAHLLGRRLVLELAEADTVDAEAEIEKMQKKVEGQVHKVRLQQLTGTGRKRFTLDGEDNEDGEA